MIVRIYPGIICSPSKHHT